MKRNKAINRYKEGEKNGKEEVEEDKAECDVRLKIY